VFTARSQSRTPANHITNCQDEDQIIASINFVDFPFKADCGLNFKIQGVNLTVDGRDDVLHMVLTQLMTALNSIEDLVGNTPMLRLQRLDRDLPHQLMAKCEFLNPGGSVKDRIAFHMVRKAEQAGLLAAGGTIVEGTAGNTGIGLALVAALRGYKLITVMSQKVSQDKVKLLEALNAEVVITPSGKSIDDPEHFMNRAKSIAEASGAWLADQFNNATNVEAHYQTTGPEIWQQTQGAIDVLVVGCGTGGTLTGAGRYLKERKKDLKIVLADPKGSMLADLVRGKQSKSAAYIVEGIGQDFVPGNLDLTLIDDVIQVCDADSVETAKDLLNKEAMFVGSSSGCIVFAALEYCRRLSGKGKTVVAVLPDGGRGYVSTIYNADWLKQKLCTQ
jgi:cystathionine beta-synthase